MFNQSPTDAPSVTDQNNDTVQSQSAITDRKNVCTLVLTMVHKYKYQSQED